MFSCVLRGTVLARVSIIQIGYYRKSYIKLFADDRLLFRTIESVADTVDSVADTVDRVADTLALQNYFSVNCHSGPNFCNTKIVFVLHLLHV